MTINYSKQVLLKRGNTAVSSTYVGPLGEVTYDTDLHQIRVHDGERAGGWIVPGGPEYDLLVPLIGNAATQQTQIDSLLANVADLVNQGNVDPGTGNETFWFNTEDGRLYIKQANVWVDSSPIELPNPSYVAGIMSDFAGNIVPAANVTYSLGTQEAQWKDLWVSNNTIYIGNTPISVQNGTLLVDGNPVSGGGNLGKFVFGSDGDSAFIHTTDDAGDLDGYDIVLIPGGEGESSITIPKQANALAGDPLVISATAANSSVAIETSSGTFSFSNLGLTFPQGSIFGTGNDDGEFVLDTWGNKPFSIYTYGGPDTYRWKFGTDGSTQFPSDTIKAPAGTFVQLSDNAGKNFVTVSDTEVTISAQDTTEYNWTFGQDGNLILPTGGNILNSDNSVYGSGGTPAGNTGEIQVNVNGAFGSYDTLTYVDNGGEMTLYAEYLNAPGIFTNNIYAGDGSPGNLILSTRYGTNWTFGSDGNLTLPTGGNILNNDGSVYGGGGTASTGNIGFVTDFIYNGYGITVENASVVPALGATAALIIPANGDTVLPLRLQNNLGNVAIIAGTDINHLQSWIFNNTGKLTTPGETWLKSGDDYNSIVFSPNGVDPYGWMKVDGGGNMATTANGNYYVKIGEHTKLSIDPNYTTLRSVLDTTIQTNVFGITNSYTFGADGSLTIPGTTNSISTTTGALIVGGGMGIHSDVHIGGTVQITDTTPSNDYTTGALVIDGGLGVNGNINLTGNINILNGNINIQEFTGSTGNFYGDIVTGFNAFYAGKSGFTALPYTVAQFSTTSNTYSQINMENTSTGKLASADFVGTADIGTDSSWFFDIGITNSGYDPVLAAENNAPGTSVGPLDTYFYVQGNLEVPETGGNLTIGTSQADKVVKFIAGGTNASDVVMTIAENGVVVAQNLTAPNLGYAADVAAANAAIITANTAMKSYVDSRPAGSTYSNANVASYLVASSQTIGNASITGTTTFGTALQIIGSTNTITTTNGSAVQFGQRANFNSINGVYSNGPFVAQGGTASTSTDTGAVRVSGGVGVSGNIYAGGNVTAPYFVGNTVGTTATYSGNVRANKFVGDGSLLTNVTVNAAGNIQGTGTNINLVAGSYTATFDNTGLFTLPAMGGDEGGEINLGIPTTNTTLQNRVAIDVFQNRIRFFEGSVDAKGAYLDLSQAAAGVGTLLNNRVSGFVNAGSFVTMDLIKATVTTSGQRGLSLATTTGTFAYNIGGTYGTAIPSSGGSSGAGTLSTTATASIFNWNFGSAGDTSTYILTDTTNSRAYRITLQIGSSYNNNMISIERLI